MNTWLSGKKRTKKKTLSKSDMTQFKWQDDLKKVSGFTEAECSDPRLWELMVVTARACIDLIEDRCEFPRVNIPESEKPVRDDEADAIVKVIKTWFRANGQIDD